MKVCTLPAGAPSGCSSDRPNSRTAVMTASKAEVARRSCSSAPLMPDVGISRASCQVSSAIVYAPVLPSVVWRTLTVTTQSLGNVCPFRGGELGRHHRRQSRLGTTLTGRRPTPPGRRGRAEPRGVERGRRLLTPQHRLADPHAGMLPADGLRLSLDPPTDRGVAGDFRRGGG